MLFYRILEFKNFYYQGRNSNRAPHSLIASCLDIFFPTGGGSLIEQAEDWGFMVLEKEISRLTLRGMYNVKITVTTLTHDYTHMFVWQTGTDKHSRLFLLLPYFYTLQGATTETSCSPFQKERQMSRFRRWTNLTTSWVRRIISPPSSIPVKGG